MIHEDGIEVWLEPVDKQGEDDRFDEIEAATEGEHDGNYKRCSIMSFAGPCTVAIRFSSAFYVEEASAIHIGRAKNQDSTVSKSTHNCMNWQMKSMQKCQKASRNAPRVIRYRQNEWSCSHSCPESSRDKIIDGELRR